MSRHQVTVEISAPPDRVWAVMRDVDRWHEWTRSVRRVERLDGKPFALGTRVRVRQPRLPPAVWEITSIHAGGGGFTWESTAPGVRVTARHEIERAGRGSRVRLSIDNEGPLGSVIGRLIAGITRRYMAMEAEGLKARSENPDYRAKR